MRFAHPLAAGRGRVWWGIGAAALLLALGAGWGVARGRDGSSAVVAPATAVVGASGAAHPATFYALHNDTSCEVPEAALPVAAVTSPMAVPTRVHLHTQMCEPTEGLEAALPVPTPPLPDAVATANFTPLPWPTLPPAPTPIADLGTLAAQSAAVARVKISGTNGAMHSFMLYTDVLEWIRNPDPEALAQTLIWVPLPQDGTYDRSALPTYPPDWREDNAEYIVFLRPDGVTPWDGTPAYAPTDLHAGFFRVRAGRIAEAGIARYQGWTVAAFEQAVRAALPAGHR